MHIRVEDLSSPRNRGIVRRLITERPRYDAKGLGKRAAAELWLANSGNHLLWLEFGLRNSKQFDYCGASSSRKRAGSSSNSGRCYPDSFAEMFKVAPRSQEERRASFPRAPDSGRGRAHDPGCAGGRPNSSRCAGISWISKPARCTLIGSRTARPARTRFAAPRFGSCTSGSVSRAAALTSSRPSAAASARR